MARKSRKVTFSKEVEIPSWKVLLAHLSVDGYRFAPTREYELFVVQERVVIYRTGPIEWTINGLDDGIKKIRGFFRNAVPQECSFVLRIFDIGWNAASATFVTLPKTQEGLRSVVKRVAKKIRPTSRSTGKVQRTPQTGTSSPFSRDAVRSVQGTYSQNSSTASSSSTFTHQVFERIVSSVRTPNFRKLERMHALPENPYSLRQTTLAPGSLVKTLRLNHVNGDAAGFSDQSWTVFRDFSLASARANHISISDNELIKKLATQIVGPSANVGESVYTIRQTINMFTSKMNVANAAFNWVSTGNLQKWARLVQAVPTKALIKASRRAKKYGRKGPIVLAELWLEYRYGMIPLLSDADALWQSFIRLNTLSSPSLGRTNARRTKSDTIAGPITGYTDNQPGVEAGRYFVQNQTTRKMTINWTLDSKLISHLSNLGLTNAPLFLWEVMPWSFVIDWAYPIGNALEAYHAFQGLAFKSGNLVQVSKSYATVRIAKTVSAPAIANVGLGYVETANGGSFGKGLLYTRSPLTGFPSPQLPQLKNPVSVIHAANAVALLTLLLTGRKVNRSF